MKVIILAAGKGTRLGHHTNDIPKALVDINGSSIIERQLKQFQNKGITDISIIVGYKKEMIIIICSKGIENTSQLLLSDIIKKIIPNVKLAILSGPSFAIEVAKKKPTAVTIASKNQNDAKSHLKTINNSIQNRHAEKYRTFTIK